MARVASDGPFSDFPGIDRTLAVIKGSGLVLTIGDDAPVTLSTESDPVSFPGDTPTSARLMAGEITDLNVMTRRGRFSHRLTANRETDIAAISATTTSPSCCRSMAPATLNFGRDSATIEHGDAALVSRAATTGLPDIAGT